MRNILLGIAATRSTSSPNKALIKIIMLANITALTCTIVNLVDRKCNGTFIFSPIASIECIVSPPCNSINNVEDNDGPSRTLIYCVTHGKPHDISLVHAGKLNKSDLVAFHRCIEN
uniref:Uncharacterized protein n=1 Tax=Glossina brevipalpis TaxID=37001 RepID=A0A1A9WRH0_9MUSC